MSTEVINKVDSLQAFVEQCPQCEMPLVHRFTPGLYSRTITMPKNALVISKIHKTEHQFVVTRGRVSVWDERNGIQTFTAGHIGITKPGTRRILFCHEETVWTTFHATTLTNVEQIEAVIIEPHDFDRQAALQEFQHFLNQNGKEEIA